MIEIIRQQTAAGVGNADGAVDKRFQLHLRHVLVNVLDLRERQLPRQDHPPNPQLAPEPDGGPVDGIGLHRKMHRDMGKLFQRETDHSRIGHDERVGSRLGETGQRFFERLDFAVGRQNVGGDVDFFSKLMSPLDGLLQRGVLERILPRAQGEFRNARVHRVGAVGERVLQLFRTARRRQQFRGRPGNRFLGLHVPPSNP